MGMSAILQVLVGLVASRYHFGDCATPKVLRPLVADASQVTGHGQERLIRLRSFLTQNVVYSLLEFLDDAKLRLSDTMMRLLNSTLIFGIPKIHGLVPTPYSCSGSNR